MDVCSWPWKTRANTYVCVIANIKPEQTLVVAARCLIKIPSLCPFFQSPITQTKSQMCVGEQEKKIFPLQYIQYKSIFHFPLFCFWVNYIV